MLLQNPADESLPGAARGFLYGFVGFIPAWEDGVDLSPAEPDAGGRRQRTDQGRKRRQGSAGPVLQLRGLRRYLHRPCISVLISAAAERKQQRNCQNDDECLFHDGFPFERQIVLT